MTDHTLTYDPTDFDALTWQGVQDDDTAQRLLRSLARNTRERDRIRRNAAAEIDRIQAKAIADEHPLTEKIGWLENELAGYLRRLRESDPKLKTYKLPGGNLTVRAGRSRTIVNDGPAFVEWALSAAPAALKIEPLVSVLTPSHGFVRTDDGPIVNADGEVVPGVEVVTGDESYGVTLNADGEP